MKFQLLKRVSHLIFLFLHCKWAISHHCSLSGDKLKQ